MLQGCAACLDLLMSVVSVMEMAAPALSTSTYQQRAWT
jgi:hypothetical protein